MEVLKRSKKQNNRKSGKAAAHLEKKCLEAATRQAAYDKLSLEEKIARARHETREHTRLSTKSVKHDV